MHPPLRALDTVGSLDRTGRLPRAALIEVPLQELAHQLLASPMQLPFEVALTHLLCFARRKVGFGLGEGGLGRRIRRLVGGSGTGADGSHRSRLPQPPLRISDHRINQDRLGRLTSTLAVPVHATATARGPYRDPVGSAVATPVVADRIHQRLHEPGLEVVVARPVHHQLGISLNVNTDTARQPRPGRACAAARAWRSPPRPARSPSRPRSGATRPADVRAGSRATAAAAARPPARRHAMPDVLDPKHSIDPPRRDQAEPEPGAVPRLLDRVLATPPDEAVRERRIGPAERTRGIL